MLSVYGIKNCSTMKRCFAHLQAQNIPYEFVDYKKQPPDLALFLRFAAAFGVEKLINKQGRSYKQLDEDKKALVLNAKAGDAKSLEAVFALVQKTPSLLKRPIVADWQAWEAGDKRALRLGIDAVLDANG